MSVYKYLLLFIATLIVIACSPTSTSAPSSPTPALTLAFSTSPSPPKMGEAEIILTLQDAQGQVLEGAEITVTAEHTDMSGMEMQGNAVEQGQGRYAIRANFSMSGNWTVRVQIKKGELSYQQDFALNVVP